MNSVLGTFAWYINQGSQIYELVSKETQTQHLWFSTALRKHCVEINSGAEDFVFHKTRKAMKS